MSIRIVSLVMVVLAALSGGCYTARVLTPRTAPAPIMPNLRLPAEPPARGTARLVVDTIDGPMDVTARGVTTETAGAKLRCRTPCIADLPHGSYDVSFSNLEGDSARGDRTRIELFDGVNVVRNAPGQYRVPQAFQWPSFALGLGGLGMLAGGAMLASTEDMSPVPGAAMLTTGVGLLIAALVVHQYVAHQQAGATTTFLAPAEN